MNPTSPLRGLRGLLLCLVAVLLSGCGVQSGNRAGVRAVAIEATFYSYGSIASDKVSGAGLLMNDSYSAANFVDRLAPLPCC